MSAEHPEGTTPFLERKETHKKIYVGLIVVCALLLIPDLFVGKHGHFSYEEWPLFYGLFGFAAYSFIVITAKGLRKLISRKEDYYDN